MANGQMKYREKILAFCIQYFSIFLFFEILFFFRNVYFITRFINSYIKGTSKNKILLIIMRNKSVYSLKCVTKGTFKH